MIMRTKTTRKNKDWSKELLARVSNACALEVAGGFPANEGLGIPHYTRQRADGSTVAGPSILEVAVWNNAKWPFMDKATPEIAAEWDKQKVDIVHKLNRGETVDAAEELGEAGETMRDVIVLEIDATTSPPNAPETIKRKQSSHPLIDNGDMKGSVTYVVRRKGGEGDDGE